MIWNKNPYSTHVEYVCCARIEARKEDGEDTMDLEVKRDEAQQALEDTETMDDLDEAENMLDELEDLMDGDSYDEDLNDSDWARAK